MALKNHGKPPAIAGKINLNVNLGDDFSILRCMMYILASCTAEVCQSSLHDVCAGFYKATRHQLNEKKASDV
jgi:hypothetical protein